ncbi:MAG TPA: Mur ligase family protein [Bacteroidales bacterium]|nr:Mur ligase family protein [Bacteroidales bacterium]
MRVHFIAIGGAVMHNLAIALHKKGYQVTGSDDEIFEPSRSRLNDYGLLPDKEGWDPSGITRDIDTIILGMHAKGDNPELEKSKKLGLNVKSFPEFLYEQTRNKKRIVIGGSHGKTTITAIIMHVLKECGLNFDYMVGSVIDGFDTMVGLSDSSEIAVFEGDEYLTSTLDRRPKFHIYKPDVAVISGIAWDHINVFPEYNIYVDQFRIFVNQITTNGTLIFNEGDSIVKEIAIKARGDIKIVAYTMHAHFQNKNGFYGATHNRIIPLKIFGEHNMQNMSAAKEVCLMAGVSEDDFYSAMQTFRGSAKRLQLLRERGSSAMYLDFAHAPSKVTATVNAVVDRYPGHRIIVCFELHTYSSLNRDFLPQYRNTLSKADRAFVYYNPHALKLKRLDNLDAHEVKRSFGNQNVEVFDDSEKLIVRLFEEKGDKRIYLLMSSGDFNGTDIKKLAEQIIP